MIDMGMEDNLTAICWYCDVGFLADSALFSRGMAILPWEARREKVLRYHFEKDRLLCLGAGLLAAYALRQSGADDLSIRFLENGKPVLRAHPGIHFNLSHSGTLAVCAVSDQTVGADVEAWRHAESQIAERCFTPVELKWMKAQRQNRQAFTRLWTRKESYLKMLGTGLSQDPNTFSVLPGASMGIPASFAEWEVREYSICVCTPLPAPISLLSADSSDLLGF